MWKTILDQALAEDHVEADVSTAAAGVSGPAEFSLWSKAEGLFCGQGLLAELRGRGFDLDEKLQSLKDGQRLAPRVRLGQVAGQARALLAVERSFLNLLGYASGIASHVSRVVQKVGERSAELRLAAPKVLATRKTHPGLRDLALHAVGVGGGDVHRRDLSAGILIKDNHLHLVGGVGQLHADSVRGGILEVASLSELQQAAGLPLRGVLLDNFSIDRLVEALDWVRKNREGWEVEVSGNITSENVQDYVLAGVNRISMGELTHTVKIFDFSFKAM